MKLTEITVARGETVNTGNFNSVRIDVSVTARIEDGDDAEAVYVHLREKVASKVAAEVARHVRSK